MNGVSVTPGAGVPCIASISYVSHWMRRVVSVTLLDSLARAMVEELDLLVSVEVLDGLTWAVQVVGGAKEG